jgi:DNA-binding response OmpR family regulator
MTLKLHTRSTPGITKQTADHTRGSGLTMARSPRVLIVEDDPAMSEMIATILSSQCINCLIRHSGSQAVKAFKNYDIDLIITDLRMGAGDGIELIESIRLSSFTPVIIVTGYSREYADRVRFLENVAVVGKPFESEDLLEMAERALDYGIETVRDDSGSSPEDFF